MQVRPTGLEPVTPRFEVWCSIQLSYGRVVDSRRDYLERYNGVNCRLNCVTLNCGSAIKPCSKVAD
jgi:hypothetical protein